MKWRVLWHQLLTQPLKRWQNYVTVASASTVMSRLHVPTSANCSLTWLPSMTMTWRRLTTASWWWSIGFSLQSNTDVQKQLEDQKEATRKNEEAARKNEEETKKPKQQDLQIQGFLRTLFGSKFASPNPQLSNWIRLILATYVFGRQRMLFWWPLRYWCYHYSVLLPLLLLCYCCYSSKL